MVSMQLIQTILIHFISFVRYNYEEKDLQSFMNRYSPQLNYAFAMILFVAIPTFNILAYFTMLASGAESGLLFSYMTFYATLSALVLISFITVLLDDFEQLKWTHLANV